MGLITAAAIYFVIWWTVLFLVLPFGMRSQADEEDVILGTTHSAPALPRLGRKVLWTTILSAAVFAAFYVVTQVYDLSPDSFPKFIPGT